MGRYTGPRTKITRRLGLLPGFTRKNIKNRAATPGEHGKMVFARSQRSSLSDDFKDRLLEKQKLRFHYGITEKQLVGYYKIAKRTKGATGTLLLELLEARLDCIVHRLGYAPTIPAARQLVNHGHLFVNGKLVNIPSFHCEKGDIITIRPKTSSKTLLEFNFDDQKKKRDLIQRRLKRIQFTKVRIFSLLPAHLEIEAEKFSGKVVSPVERNDVLVRINELKVVEYYSR